MPRPLAAGNRRVTTLRRLSGRRRARLEAGLCVIEGVVAVREALALPGVVQEVYVDHDLAQRDGAVADELVGSARAAGVEVHHLAPGLLERVADTATPQGIIALAVRRTVDATAVAGRPGPVLVLAGVADPGNAGTALRSAEAAGAAGVVFADDSVDPFGPKAVRAAAGSAFRVPVVEAGSGRPTVAALLALRGAGREVLGTVVRGGTAPEALDLTAPIALVLGSEAHGLSAEVAPLVDTGVTIPMVGAVESLNVGVAASVVLFEAARQRRVAAGSGRAPVN